MAARMLFRQVRAAKKDPRCAASCTLSEKAITLRSSLCREANICASAVLSRLDARAPRMIRASRAPAIRAIAAQLPLSALAAPLGDNGVGAKNARQPSVPATRAAIGLTARDIAAPAADLQHLSLDTLGRLLVGTHGKDIVDVHIAQEKTVVEDAQVLADVVLRGVFDAPPTGGVALAALDEREVDGVFVGFQVVGVAQAIC